MIYSVFLVDGIVLVVCGLILIVMCNVWLKVLNMVLIWWCVLMLCRLLICSVMLVWLMNLWKNLMDRFMLKLLMCVCVNGMWNFRFGWLEKLMIICDSVLFSGI